MLVFKELLVHVGRNKVDSLLNYRRFSYGCLQIIETVKIAFQRVLFSDDLLVSRQ